MHNPSITRFWVWLPSRVKFQQQKQPRIEAKIQRPGFKPVFSGFAAPRLTAKSVPVVDGFILKPWRRTKIKKSFTCVRNGDEWGAITTKVAILVADEKLDCLVNLKTFLLYQKLSSFLYGISAATWDLISIFRRKIWNLINQSKSDRIIIFTTHHLDEAEILSDCIAIIHQVWGAITTRRRYRSQMIS